MSLAITIPGRGLWLGSCCGSLSPFPPTHHSPLPHSTTAWPTTGHQAVRPPDTPHCRLGGWPPLSYVTCTLFSTEGPGGTQKEPSRSHQQILWVPCQPLWYLFLLLPSSLLPPPQRTLPKASHGTHFWAYRSIAFNVITVDWQPDPFFLVVEIYSCAGLYHLRTLSLLTWIVTCLEAGSYTVAQAVLEYSVA